MSEEIITKQILEAILRIKQKHPEYRFGQIIANATRRAGYVHCDPFHIPDVELLQSLETELGAKKDE
jgi:hypothetical protein